MLIFNKVGNKYYCTSRNLVVDANTFYSLASTQDWAIAYDGNNISIDDYMDLRAESLAAYLVCTKKKARELLQSHEYTLIDGVWEYQAEAGNSIWLEFQRGGESLWPTY